MVKNHKVSCVEVRWLGKKGDHGNWNGGPLVNLDTILRFQNSQTLLNLPCLFCHPCVMKLVMPCLETTYFAMRFVLLKLFFHCSSFLQSPFFSQNSCQSMGLQRLGHDWATDTSFHFSLSSAPLLSWLTSLSFRSQHKCPLFGDIFSFSTLFSLSNKDSTLFIFFIAVTISLNYLFINTLYSHFIFYFVTSTIKKNFLWWHWPITHNLAISTAIYILFHCLLPSFPLWSSYITLIIHSCIFLS